MIFWLLLGIFVFSTIFFLWIDLDLALVDLFIAVMVMFFYVMVAGFPIGAWHKEYTKPVDKVSKVQEYLLIETDTGKKVLDEENVEVKFGAEESTLTKKCRGTSKTWVPWESKECTYVLSVPELTTTG